MEKEKDTREVFLSSSILCINNECRDGCLYCIVEERFLREKGRISIESVRNFLSRFGCYGGSLRISGFGEPLLDERVTDIVRMAKEYGYGFIEILTNIRHISREMARDLVGLGLSSLVINLPAPDGETHMKLRPPRGEKGFSEVLKGIEIVKEERMKQGKNTPLVVIRCIVNRYNIGKLKGMVSLTEKVGADKLIFAAMIKNKKIHERIWADPSQEETLNRVREALSFAESRGIEAEAGEFGIGLKEGPMDSCPRIGTVDFKGNMVFCCEVPESICNIGDNKIDEIISSEKITEIAKRNQKLLCKGCPFREFI